MAQAPDLNYHPLVTLDEFVRLAEVRKVADRPTLNHFKQAWRTGNTDAPAFGETALYREWLAAFDVWRFLFKRS